MIERITLDEAIEFSAVASRIDDGQVIDALSDANTELKAAALATLELERPVLMTDVLEKINTANTTAGRELHRLGSDHIWSVLRAMNRDFVIIEGESRKRAAILTEKGYNLSRGIAGHLVQLGVDSNTPLRQLVGENRKPVKDSSRENNGAIENRLNILTCLYGLASERFVSATKITTKLDGIVAARTFRKHATKLEGAGLIEVREPSADKKSELKSEGFQYRIKQENGYISPVETIDRFLAIVVMTKISETYPEFMSDGNRILSEYSLNPIYAPALLKRSFMNTAHTGKKC